MQYEAPPRLSPYARWRSGKASLWVIALGCAAWAGWNLTPWLPHFDDGEFGRLTTILSVEASLMASILLAYMQKQDTATRLVLNSLVELAQAQHAVLGVIRDQLMRGPPDVPLAGRTDTGANPRLDRDAAPK